MNVQPPEIQARHFFDGLIHLYLGREFAAPNRHLVTPLHSDASWHPDDHERHKVGEPVAPAGDVELCEQCVAVAFQMKLGLPVVPVVPEPRTLRKERATSRTRWFRSGKRPNFVPSPWPRRRARATSGTKWYRSGKRPMVEAIHTATDEQTRPLMAVAI
jgi:hypothetical protein